MPLNSEFPPATEISETEVGVRRALGIDGVAVSSGRQTQQPSAQYASDRQKRRFAQDGEVPVVVIHGRRDHGLHATDPRAMGSSATNRLGAAETALKAEREARERAERSLTEAQAIIRDLQTKLAHAVLARDEARETVRRAEIEKHVVELELAAERNAREKAEDAKRQSVVEWEEAEECVREPALRSKKVAKRKSTAQAPTIGSVGGASRMTKVKPRARSKEPEPRPVRWWLKSKKSTGLPK